MSLQTASKSAATKPCVTELNSLQSSSFVIPSFKGIDFERIFRISHLCLRDGKFNVKISSNLPERRKDSSIAPCNAFVQVANTNTFLCLLKLDETVSSNG